MGTIYTDLQPLVPGAAYICCILVGISAGLASHWALDYWSIIYYMPLGEPLKIITH